MKKMLVLILAVALIPLTFVAPSSGEVDLSGYAQMWGEYGEKEFDGRTYDNTLRGQIKRARVKLTGEVLDNITYKLSTDLKDNAELYDAAVTFTHLGDAAHITLGQFKPHVSKEALRSSSELDFIERYQGAIYGIGDDAPTGEPNIGLGLDNEFRNIGVMLSGHPVEIFSYSLFMGNSGGGANLGTTGRDNLFFSGRIEASLIDALRFGAAYANTEKSNRGGFDKKFRTQVWTLDASYDVGGLTIAGEFIGGNTDATTNQGFSGASATGKEVVWHAYYIMGAYWITDNIRGLVRFEEFDPDTAVTGSDSYRYLHYYTFGLNYYFDPDDIQQCKLQLEYQIREETSPDLADNILRLALQVSF